MRHGNLRMALAILVGCLVVSCGRDRVRLPQEQPKKAPVPTPQPQNTDYGPAGDIPNITNFTDYGMPVWLPNTSQGQCSFDNFHSKVPWTSSANVTQREANIAKALKRNNIIGELFKQWQGYVNTANIRKATTLGWDGTTTILGGAWLAFGKKLRGGTTVISCGDYDPEVHGKALPIGCGLVHECSTVYVPAP